MRFVIQRVLNANVKVDGNEIGAIDKGFVVLIGISNEDTKDIADKMVDKMLKLRIFEDADGKTNLSIFDVSGSLLLISQFTLYADCKKGNRPSFTDALQADRSIEFYRYFNDYLRKQDIEVEEYQRFV